MNRTIVFLLLVTLVFFASYLTLLKAIVFVSTLKAILIGYSFMDLKLAHKLWIALYATIIFFITGIVTLCL